MLLAISLVTSTLSNPVTGTHLSPLVITADHSILPEISLLLSKTLHSAAFLSSSWDVSFQFLVCVCTSLRISEVEHPRVQFPDCMPRLCVHLLCPMTLCTCLSTDLAIEPTFFLNSPDGDKYLELNMLWTKLLLFPSPQLYPESPSFLSVSLDSHARFQSWNFVQGNNL